MAKKPVQLNAHGMLNDMYISRLVVQDFRSYHQAQLELGPGVTVLLGPNGAGKTNLVEAITYSARLGSHRVANDAALVRESAAQAFLQVNAVRDGRQASVDIQLAPGGKSRARVNRNPVPRMRDVVGVLQVVLFAPNDVDLVRGDPAGRRNFLDELLVAHTPRLGGVRSDFDKALRQRSALLKSLAASTRGGRSGLATEDEYTWQVWDEALVRHGAALLQARLQLVDQLNPLLDKAYSQISGQTQAATKCQAKYVATGCADQNEVDLIAQVRAVSGSWQRWDLSQCEQWLTQQMQAKRAQELARGVCLVGPQRDELALLLGINPQLPARTHASHGETWSVALALRVASAWLLQGGAGATDMRVDSPVVILDDVLAELDTQRRQRLAQIVSGFEQVIITAADPNDLGSELAGRVISVPEQVQQTHPATIENQVPAQPDRISDEDLNPLALGE